MMLILKSPAKKLDYLSLPLTIINHMIPSFNTDFGAKKRSVPMKGTIEE
jgi:hypothetical protein